MLNVDHFRELIIRPVLLHLDMHSEAAENLVLGTAIKESSLCYLKQLGGGPAIGLYQMEPVTFWDIKNYLARKDNSDRDGMYWKVTDTMAREEWSPEEMAGNLNFATAMCRIHYWRRPEPLPDAGDADAMGEYWRQWYNSPLGAGVAEDFARLYRQYVIGS